MAKSALKIKLTTKPSLIELAKTVLDTEIQGLIELRDTLGFEFDQTVDAIYNAKGRVIICGVGKSGHVAKKIVATLASTGTPAIFVHASEASHGDLGMITEGDVVLMLSNSGESPELANIIDYCKRFEILLIGVARKANSQLMKASDIKFLLPNTKEASDIDAPTTSTTMMMALGDAIAVALHNMRGFSREDFKIFHPGGNIGAKLLKVADLMHVNETMPLVNENENCFAAIVEMTRKRLGCVGVVNTDGVLIGIFTDGDLRRHVDSDFKALKISEIMTLKPMTIDKDLFASEALRIMNKMSITILFIAEEGKPSGIVHMHDILRAKVV
ncbi:MAG: SIS domain-containing protein [Rickettsiales bacterium]